jgi:hypothetical protein
VQRAVCRPPEERSDITLRDLGLEDLAFEAFVMRHEASFNAAAIEASKARLEAAAEEPTQPVATTASR